MPFETLFQHHPQPMVLFGSETLRIYAANDAAGLHYGYSGERFVGLKATDLWHEDDRERFARVLPQLAFARPVGPTRWRHRHSSGAGFDVELHATSIVVGPEPAWLIIAASVPTKVDGGEPNLKVAALEAAFIAAVDRGTIDVVYQPFVAADDGRIVGFEALARWTDPEHGAISPDIFVPLAEATGSIVTMGRSIMERACGRLRRAIDRTGS
ncbi:MAG: sensor domain-containing phosphodiesterase, partial [Vulcanimicrobiaceae bacterium]